MPLASVPLDAELKALAALVTASLAVVVLSSSRRRIENQLLAVFLLLICGNQAAETVRAVASDDTVRLTAFRLATLFAALDPFALAWFVLKRRELDGGPRDTLALVVLLIVSTCFAGVAVFYFPLGTAQEPFGLLLSLYTAFVYTGLLLLEISRGGRSGTAAPDLGVGALLIAALPVWINSTAYPVSVIIRPRLQGLLTIAVGEVLVIGGVVAVIAAVARHYSRSPEYLRQTYKLLGLALVVTAILDVSNLIGGVVLATVGREVEEFQIVGRSGAPLRWLLFSALMSIVLLRHDVLGFRVRQRRRAARILITLGVLATLGFALAVAQVFVAPEEFALRPLDAILVTLVVLLSQTYRGFVDDVARRVYGVPPASDVAARQAAYQEAVTVAMAEGRAGPDSENLRELRHDLEIDEMTAVALTRAAEASNTAPLVPGRLVNGRYRVESLIGRGGAGRTFLACDQVLRRPVAIKEVMTDGGADEERVLKEARLAGEINHPNIVTVHDVVRRRNGVLIVSEFVNGGSLADEIEREGRLSTKRAIALLEEILEGLAAVHARRIVHRDLKPANILLTEEGRPKIADFGIASLREDATSSFGVVSMFQGTAGYMSPEQMRGEAATLASDIFAVGLLARAISSEPFQPATEAVVNRALAKQPGTRWADAAEMLAALRRSSLNSNTRGVSDPHQ